MDKDRRHSVSVAGVVVNDDGRALIVRRADNEHWEPPGGVLEHGETIQDGLVREVFEETGLKVEPVGLTGVYQNMPGKIVALVFRCRTVAGQLTTNDEATAFYWAAASELPELLDEAYAVRVLDALRDDSVPAVRAHDGVSLI